MLFECPALRATHDWNRKKIPIFDQTQSYQTIHIRKTSLEAVYVMIRTAHLSVMLERCYRPMSSSDNLNGKQFLFSGYWSSISCYETVSANALISVYIYTLTLHQKRGFVSRHDQSYLHKGQKLGFVSAKWTTTPSNKLESFISPLYLFKSLIIAY